jgi:dUTP pyrophosphatase
MKELKIKYIRDIKPIAQVEGSDWIDLRAAEEIRLDAGEYTVIPLGVAMELPDGYEAIIAPRSSTYAKWGIICTNSIGIIDHAYRGDRDEWGFPVIAMRKTVVHKNDRVCQFRIIENQGELNLRKVKQLGNVNRGGFGSTGEQ